MTRAQRRAAVLAGLVLDILSAMALAGAVLAGVIPAGRTAGPAVTLAAGITIGTACLYSTRTRSRS